MNLIQMLTTVAGRAGLELSGSIPNNLKVKDLLIDIYNLRHADFNTRHDWPWREKTTTLQTILNYTAGTVTVTNGSRTVTGSGTAFTSAMAGRFLKMTADNEMYEIGSVTNGTTLVLQQPYVGTSASGSYLIWNRYYNLPPDVPMNADIVTWQYPFRSIPIPKKSITHSYQQAYLAGIPIVWTWGRINRVNNRYSTGTVSVTQDSKTLTGTNTSFLGNVFEGGKITVGTNIYNIESVDTDTQVTMVQNGITSLSGQTYTMDTGSRQTIIFSTTPNPAINLNVTYPKQTYPLKNDNDTTEIWPGFEHILETAVYGELLDKLTSDKAFAWLTIYEKQVEAAWNSICNNDTPDSATRYANTSITGYRAGLYD